ncbi:MAG: J domain-containing protein, partial [Candidatus Woesearchaeota archaeon]
DNIQLAFLCIKADVDAIFRGEISVKDFETKYVEHGDVHEDRKWAREFLGVHHECGDITEINAAYKNLARKHHPDMEGGSAETFKRINDAHKILKRELE